MSDFDFAKLHGASGAENLINELRRMEEERSRWMSAKIESHRLVDEIDKMMGSNSAAVRLAQQMNDVQRAHGESIRKMLAPLENIRSRVLNDSSIQRMMDDLKKQTIAANHYQALIDQVTGPSAQLSTLYSRTEDSLELARKMFAETSVSNSLQQMMKGFEEVNKRWSVPTALIDALTPLQAWQEQIGRLSLPIIDVASAATLSKLLGREGIEAQLAALGIDPDGSLNAQFASDRGEEGIGLSRKSLELLALLGFIWAILTFIYQDISSARWQAATDEKLATQAQVLETQRNMIESLSKLVEKALVHESQRQEQRLVVRDRVTLVRSKPESGSSVVGKLFPQEVVIPIAEDGKWVQFEYYHWLHQEYRTGWALKKYFQRVARPSKNSEQIEQ